MRSYNQLVANAKQERSRLVDDCWHYFVDELLTNEVATYKAELKGLNEGIQALEPKVAQAELDLAEMRSRLRALKSMASSSLSTITAINARLSSMGFTNFFLAPTGGEGDGYAIVREDGPPVDRTLSEGERTFITFLYFVEELKDIAAADEAEGIVAVPDDPISNLASEVMFVVAGLVRQLMQEAQSGAGRVRQVIALTHNAYYHLQIARLGFRESATGRAFVTLRKRPGAPTLMTMHGESNPVRSTYIALWGEVRRASSGDVSRVTL